MRKLCGAKWSNEENWKGPVMMLWIINLGGPLMMQWANKTPQWWWNWGRLMTWWGNWGWYRPLILFKRFDMALWHSFKRMGPKFKLRNFVCQASWKRIHGALILHCSVYISKIVWWLPMFDFGIFCHLLKLMRIYRMGPCPGIWKVLFSLFPSSFFFFFFFLPFLSFIFNVCLSGASLALGPLDIVQPCHPVATPLFATENQHVKGTRYPNHFKGRLLHLLLPFSAAHPYTHLFTE